MAQKVGRREKLAQKVGRREIYSPVPPPLSGRRYLPPKIERIPIYRSRQEPIYVVNGMRECFRHTEEKPF